jgi:hypothetical protein
VREQRRHRLRVEGELGKARAFGIALEQTEGSSGGSQAQGARARGPQGAGSGEGTPAIACCRGCTRL